MKSFMHFWVLSAAAALAWLATSRAQNDLSAVPRGYYPPSGMVYKIPELKNLVHQSMKNSYVYGDFVVGDGDGKSVVFQTYTTLTLFGNVTDPQQFRLLAQQGSILMGATRVMVDAASCPIQLTSGCPIHIPMDSPLQLISVTVSQAGNIIAYARFPGAKGREALPPADAKASSVSPDDKFLAADPRTGIQVWRPYSGRIEWDGEADGNRLASGPGTLRVYTKNGQVAAVLVGPMTAGRMAGQVNATYPLSSDRASYSGEFANWSENGRGVMILRNGQRVEGTWRDGDLVQSGDGNAAGAAPGAPEAPRDTGDATQPVAVETWASDAVFSNLYGNDNDAGGVLQKTYDSLKSRLQADARVRLVKAQRAWITYNEDVMKLARQKWGNRPDVGDRVEQLDFGMVLQRTRELKYMLGFLDGGNIGDISDAGCRNTNIALQAVLEPLGADARIDKGLAKQMLSSWRESEITPAVLAALSPGDDQRQEIERVSSAMMARHQIDLIQFWQQAAWMNRPTPPQSDSSAAAARIAASAKMLAAQLKTAWGNATPVEKWPPQLPADVEEKLRQAVADLKSAGDQSQSILMDGAMAQLVLGMADTINRAWKASPPDAGAVMDALDGAPSSCVGDTHDWINALRTDLLARRDKALQAQKDALALFAKGDSVAVDTRLVEALREFPSARLAAWKGAFTAYEALAVDKSLRAMDTDWKSPTLPEAALINAAVESLRSIRDNADAKEICSDWKPLLDGLLGAALLGSFSTDFAPSGNSDRPHPIVAWQSMLNRDSYKQVMASSSPFAAPFIKRLKSLDALIGPQLKQFQALQDQGQKFEDAGKYLAAAKSYRAALVIEITAELQQKASKCEAQISGL